MSMQITTGAGNENAPTLSREMKAGAAIAKGDIVALSGTTGYTVIKCTDVLAPCGVAGETIASGDWGKIITGGFCDYLTCTTANIVDGDILYCDASSDAAGITAGDDLSTVVGSIIGVTLQAQEGTTITAAYISPVIKIV